MLSDTTIIIDSGSIFYGNLKQFEECFFANATEDSIRAWADDNGFTVELEEPSYP